MCRQNLLTVDPAYLIQWHGWVDAKGVVRPEQRTRGHHVIAGVSAIVGISVIVIADAIAGLLGEINRRRT